MSALTLHTNRDYSDTVGCGTTFLPPELQSDHFSFLTPPHCLKSTQLCITVVATVDGTSEQLRLLKAT